MKIKRSHLVVVFCLGWLSVCGQRGVLTGKIKDYDSAKPISNAYISGNNAQAISDTNGVFRLLFSEGDSVEVSHIGYETLYLSPTGTYDTLFVQMRQSTTELQAITILDYMTEETLRSKVLETPVVESEYEKNARENALKANMLFKLGYRAPMTEIEKFQHYLKGPQSVTFFSSSGGGLIKVLKNLSGPPSAPRHSFNRNARPAGLYFIKKPPLDVLATMDSTNLVEADSLIRN